jgi:hypothetical protein
MPGRAVKFPTGPSNSRLYGGNVKSNALGLPGGGGLIAVGFDSYIKKALKSSESEAANRPRRSSPVKPVGVAIKTLRPSVFILVIFYRANKNNVKIKLSHINL